ncbi:hypothetical protein [uncultured Aquimarina sp.]|uniref:hypothetical protein n=1 Tax=uncultured Aquimarina sp. TaxID=575652 RepID=UPI0026332A87|nr:hypothetical protein [uncultured Aquimarina sp.]
MRHTVFLLAIFISNLCISQTAPFTCVKKINPDTRGTEITISAENSTNNIITEVPPWIIMGCWRGYFYNEVGRNTRFITTAKNMVDNTEAGSCNSFIEACIPKRTDFNVSVRIPNYTISEVHHANWQTRSTDHIRNYAGIYAAETVKQLDKIINIGFVHGENGANYSHEYQNNFRSYDTTAVWSAPLENYYAFLSMAWLKSNQENGWGHEEYNDMGPIAWPSTGYLKNATKINYDNNSTAPTFSPYYRGGEKLTSGLRHPSSIKHNGYIYVFFSESSPRMISASGIKVLRVPESQATNPNAYKIYYNGGWYKSLPENFTKERLADFLQVEGPKSTSILGSSHRFSVAKVRDTNYFIGVREYRNHTNKTYHISLHKSFDLTNWSEGYDIYFADDQDGQAWSKSDLHYPIFMDKYGKSNTVIDRDKFYILFSKTNGFDKIRRWELNLTCSDDEIPCLKPLDFTLSKENNTPSTTLLDCSNIYIKNNILMLPVLTNGSYSIEIYNISGQRIMSKSLSNKENLLSLKNYAPKNSILLYTLKNTTTGNYCNGKIVF